MTDRSKILRGLGLAVAVAAATAVVVALLQMLQSPPQAKVVSGQPPPSVGYFTTAPPGSWKHLPDDDECAHRVHESAWEPRPENWTGNHTMPDTRAVHRALASRPRAVHNAYDPRWDSWLLARVTGHHVGSTDENIQWAACKWGISDNVLRAIAVRESEWYQYLVYPGGRCVQNFGCGDVFPTADGESRQYCEGLARSGHDYQVDYGWGRCPKTFSIVGVMSWEDPSWGRWADNQNGTFSFNRDSTAFALDYLGAYLRGCYEGWLTWLQNTGNHRYVPGDLWGCVGSWYAGAWYSPAAVQYLTNVRAERDRRTWLIPNWADTSTPTCSPDFGCPRGP